MYNYYFRGELFCQTKWTGAASARLDESGERIISGVVHSSEKRDGTPIEEWLHTVPARNLLEDITEVYRDMWEQQKNKTG